MKIVSAKVYPLQIPFTDGGTGTGLMPVRWTHLQIALLKLETSDGLTGWGEAFAYAHLATTVSALNELVLPMVIGQTIEDISAFNRSLQQKTHLHGRYGITQFALSAVDIALWDIAAKQANQSLAQFLSSLPSTQLNKQPGLQPKTKVPAYASLVRYGDPETITSFSEQAVASGYEAIKLHEITYENILAAREVIPDAIKLTTDINCNWNAADAERLLPAMKEMNLYWVEEPLFPPDSEAELAKLQAEHGVSIASGENACTSVEFSRLAPSIDYIQPSVIKVGGVTEFLKVCDVASATGKTVMPHSPYFGPGYQATLQLMAAREECGLFEHLYIDVENYLDTDMPLPEKGFVEVPARPGIGFDPDMDMLERYGKYGIAGVRYFH